VSSNPSAVPQNTSGQGKSAIVPPEIDRWNWGAFLLNWIWGLGNRVYIALLMFVPFVNIVMSFVLGAKGSAWAWKNRRWESVEHFKRVQRLWAIAGVIVLALAIAMGVGVFFAVSSMMKNSDAYRLGVAKVQASPEAMALLGAPLETGMPKGSFNTSGPTGEAQLSIPVEGQKAKGMVYLEATKNLGQWNINNIVLELEGHPERIDLNRTPQDDYAEGMRVYDQQKDYAKAAKLFRKAAEAGNASAQFELGLIYDDGKGVAQDYKQAMAWYEKAAAQGNAPAQYNLGVLYGQGVEQDYKKALELYEKAAKQGFTKVQVNLGILYVEGQGTAQDNVEAYKWWALARENGSDDAKSNLEKLEPKMTPEQIAEGQRRVEAWKKALK
jgi:TPR repeat protein